MAVRQTDDGRNIYCSTLLDDSRLSSIFSRGLDNGPATIYDASFGPYRKGVGGENGLHIEVRSDSYGDAGIWFTDKGEIKSIFRDIAGIRLFPWSYRLKGKRVEASHAGELFVGISPLKKESEPVS